MKVAAIFDKPKSCGACPCSHLAGNDIRHVYCQLNGYDDKIKFDHDAPIPDWCPLREVTVLGPAGNL